MIRGLFWLIVIGLIVLVASGRWDRSATTCTATVVVDGVTEQVPCQ